MRKFRSLVNVEDLKTRLLAELARADLSRYDIVARPAKKKVPVSIIVIKSFSGYVERLEEANRDGRGLLDSSATVFAGKSY